MISSAKGGRHDAPLAEINVTPLVDVMLVMLAIFLVVAPVMTKAIKVELPKVAAQTAVRQDHAVTVSLDAGGRVFVDGRQVDASRLEPMLAHAVAQDAHMSVTLRADRRESLDAVAKVLAAVARAGVTRVSVLTTSEHLPSGASSGH